MKRYRERKTLRFNGKLVSCMEDNDAGEWVRYKDAEKLETALKVISIWALHPEEHLLDQIRIKALEALDR